MSHGCLGSSTARLRREIERIEQDEPESGPRLIYESLAISILLANLTPKWRATKVRQLAINVGHEGLRWPSRELDNVKMVVVKEAIIDEC